jgi:UDP-GlcNAc:undecaprenyl-phosphate GlcNAc-1-phosphate transferase
MVTAVFMFALRPVAVEVGLVDRPGGRKSHVGEVPIIGGIAMFLGMFIGLVVVPIPGDVVLSVFVGSALLVIVGVFDDRMGLPPTVRIATQIAVVLIMVYGAGLSLAAIGDPFGMGDISMGRFTLALTALVSLTLINAYNLIDGADGLAGSLAAIALMSVAIASGLTSLPAAIAITVVAAIVGYLVFNFPTPWNTRLRTFMGDAGSTLLGFTIVWITLSVTQGPERLISPVHCLWFASVPIYDCLTCFVRRILDGKSPFTPGRDHFHHTLLRGGMPVRKNLAVLAGLQGIYAMVGLVGHFANVPDVVMFAGWAVIGLSQRFAIVQLANQHRLRGLKRRRAN